MSWDSSRTGGARSRLTPKPPDRAADQYAALVAAITAKADEWDHRAHENVVMAMRMSTELRAVVADAGTAALDKVRADALREAADDVRRIRESGLGPDEQFGPSDRNIEQWLRDRADHIEGDTHE